MAGGSYRILHASEAAVQPIPQYLSLNYADLFKIQRVINPFPLRPISFSRLTSYLECPNCALEQQRRRGKREPRHFTTVHQASLFAAREPDPRLVGTLLHAVVDLLHDPQGPLEVEQQASLLVEPVVLTRFIRYELLDALREAGKLKLAMFFDEIADCEELLRSVVLHPMLSYQRELRCTGSTVFAASERFQFKLLSTGKTFTDHRDWGGYVGLVGEFDQIRLHNRGDIRGRPAIMEFKKGLGKKRSWDKWGQALESEFGASVKSAQSDDLLEPGLAHAFQLMVYWLAFQTRWDVMGRVLSARGQIDELAMSLYQELDLIIYNLHDGCQYQLVPTDFEAALLAVTNCIFYANWAMKSGYAWQSPEHDCGKTPLLSDVPNPQVQVGTSTISAEACYELAREAFQRFSATVCWCKLFPIEEPLH
ncbi:MAG TPA: PD-(D/E)XK nuclease family protein [Ktedonobacteraceae bacterium]